MRPEKVQCDIQVLRSARRSDGGHAQIESNRRYARIVRRLRTQALTTDFPGPLSEADGWKLDNPIVLRRERSCQRLVRLPIETAPTSIDRLSQRKTRGADCRHDRRAIPFRFNPAGYRHSCSPKANRARGDAPYQPETPWTIDSQNTVWSRSMRLVGLFHRVVRFTVFCTALRFARHAIFILRLTGSSVTQEACSGPPTPPCNILGRLRRPGQRISALQHGLSSKIVTR